MKIDITAVEANELFNAINCAEGEGMCEKELLIEFINAVGPLLEPFELAQARRLLGRKFLLLKPLSQDAPTL